MPRFAPSSSKKQRPARKRWRAGVFAAISVLCAVGALNALVVRASAPKPMADPPAKRAHQQDEAALHLRILQENAKYATHVGIASEKYAVDPDPAMMRRLRGKYPNVRPVSELVEPESKGGKKRFYLVIADVEWTNANKAQVDSLRYHSDSYAMGSYSRQHYLATRDKADKTQWRLASDALACGGWTQVPIKTPQGTVRTLLNERIRPE